MAGATISGGGTVSGGGTISGGGAAARAAEAERRLGSGVQQVLLLPYYPTTLSPSSLPILQPYHLLPYHSPHHITSSLAY